MSKYGEFGQFLWLDLITVQDFLKAHGKGPGTKDYEFVAAIFLAKFCEQQFGRKCQVGFKIKDVFNREIAERGTATIDEIADILRKKVEEATPIDVVVTPETDRFDGKRKGVAFQLKRFGRGVTDGTEKLIEYLNKDIKKQYAPVPHVSLVLLMECAEMDTKKLRGEIVTEDFPFERIMFVTMRKGSILQIGEFWPNAGVMEYDMSSYREQK